MAVGGNSTIEEEPLFIMSVVDVAVLQSAFQCPHNVPKIVENVYTSQTLMGKCQ